MQPLHTAVVALTGQNLTSLIDGHPFVVVDFRAASSAACRAFAPVFAAAAQRHPSALFATVDSEQQQAVCAQFGIHALPTLVVIRNNIVVHAQAGVLPAAALDDVLRAAQALDMDEARCNVNSEAAFTLGGPPVPATAADTGQLSIESYLNPALRGPDSALRQVVPRLAAGELVVIPNAFEPDFAERMYQGLDRCKTWRLYESYDEHFHYHHHSLYLPDEYPPELALCARIFDAPETKSWATRLSGRACDGPAEVGASWYLPGDHSLPHNDIADCGANMHRQVAFVWHLAKDWRSEWGGALYWCPKATYLTPAFNTLYLFNLGPGSAHFVTAVSPYVQGKRLAVNGWWTGPAATAGPVWKGPDRISAGTTDILVY